MSYDYDVCVVGSGAGAGPIAFTLSQKGFSVLVLEKGSWLTEKDFTKDEMACCLRNGYTPDLKEQPHVVEQEKDEGGWWKMSTDDSSWNFWNGNVVGGSSNFMSGFFHRLKPVDFRQVSTFGKTEGANVVDWPITYDDLEPYYDKVEKVVGVSGKVVSHPFQEPRSSKDFPYPPTAEHPIAQYIDQACQELGFHSIPMPRAILSQPDLGRNSCAYSGYCGAYGCATGAKGSSRAALLDKAVASGNCEIRANAHVTQLHSDQSGKISKVEYVDAKDKHHHVNAKIYVVACQAIETSRLLLNSPGPKHPDGLANNNAQVGKNLLFAGGGAGSGRLRYAAFNKDKAAKIAQHPGAFINRSVQDWYVIDDKDFGPKLKGGTIDFVHLHPNPVARASRKIWDNKGLVWGSTLQDKIKAHFQDGRFIKIEAFSDWTPVDDCFVSLDPEVKDKWGNPVAKVRVGFHVNNLKAGWYLATKGADILKQMGAEDVVSFAAGDPPTNLVAGGCRFGEDPKFSVLNKNCQAHDVENLYISDGSFMPTGGSVPYTWTIYANSFRVADKIAEHLGGS